MSAKGYQLLSKNYILQDVELVDEMVPKSTEPVSITYPTYMKVVQYIAKSDHKYDLVESIYRKDLSEEVERRKKLPKFYKGDMSKQLHIVRVDAMGSDAQTQMEATEDVKISVSACRVCGGAHFTSKCPRGSVAYTAKYDLSMPDKQAMNLNNISDYCYSIRVSNLPRNCTEDDWKKTIQLLQGSAQFRIRMIGIRRGNFNGTCIVLYKSEVDAERGLRIFNKMKYGPSILDCAPADDTRR